MSEGEQKATSAGTSAGVLEQTKSEGFLLRCIKRAAKAGKVESDMVQDILDACEINELTALDLGSQLLTVSEASEKLFLMPGEACAILEFCRAACLRAGVNYGDGGVADPADGDEDDEEDDPPAAPAPPPPAATSAPSAPAPAAATAAAPAAAAAPTPAPVSAPPPAAPKASTSAPADASSAAKPTTKIPTSHFTPHAAAKEHHSGPLETNFLIKPPLGKIPSASTPNAGHGKPPATPATPAVAPTPRDKLPPRPKATPSSAQTPRMAARPSSAAAGSSHASGSATPTSGAAPATSAVKSAMKTPRPSTAPLRTPKTPAASLGGVESTPTVTRPQSAATPRSNLPLPSYAKPTAAAQARLAPATDSADSPSTSAATPAAGSQSVSSKPPLTGRGTLRASFAYSPKLAVSDDKEKKEIKKPVFDKIRSSLLKPTKAFLAWTAGKGKDAKEEEMDMTKMSGTKLAASAPRPFTLSESKSNKSRPLTTEEQQLAEMQSYAFKARPVPKSISRPARDADGVSASAGGASPQPLANGSDAAVRSVSASEGGVAVMQRSGGGSVSHTTTPEPFKLTGMDRHAKAQEELAKKIEEKARAEASFPKFKASPAPPRSGIPAAPGAASPAPATASTPTSPTPAAAAAAAPEEPAAAAASETEPAEAST